MRYLISDIAANGDGEEQEGGDASIVSLDAALSTANVAVLDPGFLTDADIAKLLPDGPACTFAYTTASPPVLAVGPDGSALVKLSGDLIRLEAEDADALASGPTLTAEGISARLNEPEGAEPLEAGSEPQVADLILSLDAGLRAGYQGYYGCET